MCWLTSTNCSRNKIRVIDNLNVFNEIGNDICQLIVNPLKPELNPIFYLLALLGAHHFVHVSRIRVKSLTFRRLMTYIYIYMWSTHS